LQTFDLKGNCGAVRSGKLRKLRENARVTPPAIPTGSDSGPNLSILMLSRRIFG
jgi:hypothetical protein